jgi:hypothetical protein
MKLWVFLLVVLTCVAGAPSVQSAERERDGEDAGSREAAPLFAEVLVLHATNGGKGIDRRIGEMPELGRAPFSAYDSYALLDRARLPLDKHARRLMLPNGSQLKIDLRERLGEDQVRFAASVTRPKGKQVLPLLEVKAKVGQRFVVAGQSFKKGILVLVIRPVR